MSFTSSFFFCREFYFLKLFLLRFCLISIIVKIILGGLRFNSIFRFRSVNLNQLNTPRKWQYKLITRAGLKVEAIFVTLY